jgi:hypothetical protein
MTSLRLGVVAEDDTDCDVIDVLARRILPDVRLRIDRRRDGGGPKLRIKAAAWMRELAENGCLSVVLLHDLDRNPSNEQLRNEQELRRHLAAIPVPKGVERLLCIPVEELEAWFWSDQKLISQLGRGRGRRTRSLTGFESRKKS